MVRLTFVLMLALPATAQDVLLTFDTEDPRDEEALQRLALPGPCTFFITGSFARRFEARLVDLSKTHELACHTDGHPHLKGLDSLEQNAQIKVCKDLIERISRNPCVGFRAPYLEYNAETLSILEELGFAYDSSDSEARGVFQGTLPELPLSTILLGDRRESADDYFLFDQAKLDDEHATAILTHMFDERSAIGRPMVILLHPRIIGQHPNVFNDFVAHVRKQSGAFRTCHDLARAVQAVQPTRKSVRVNLEQGPVNPAQIVQDARQSVCTDLLLSAADSPAFDETAQLAEKAGLKVHAWVSVGADEVAARKRPEAQMESVSAGRVAGWVCFNNAVRRRELLDRARALLQKHPFAGLHLTLVGYPLLDSCTCATCVEMFRHTYSLPALAPKEIVEQHSHLWAQFREAQIARFLTDVRRAMNSVNVTAELSMTVASLAPSTSPEAELGFGQSLTTPATLVDWIVVDVPFKALRQSPGWATRALFLANQFAGRAPIWAGLESSQNPPKWSYLAGEFSEAMQTLSSGHRGFVVWSYSDLFARGPAANAMPPGSVEAFRILLAPPPPPTAPRAPQPKPRTLLWWLCIGSGIGALVCAGFYWKGRRKATAGFR